MFFAPLGGFFTHKHGHRENKENGFGEYLSNAEFSYINELLKSSDLKKSILFFEINSKKTIFLISIKKDTRVSDLESLGAEFHTYIKYKKKKWLFYKFR